MSPHAMAALWITAGHSAAESGPHSVMHAPLSQKQSRSSEQYAETTAAPQTVSTVASPTRSATDETSSSTTTSHSSAHGAVKQQQDGTVTAPSTAQQHAATPKESQPLSSITARTSKDTNLAAHNTTSPPRVHPTSTAAEEVISHAKQPSNEIAASQLPPLSPLTPASPTLTAPQLAALAPLSLPPSHPLLAVLQDSAASFDQLYAAIQQHDASHQHYVNLVLPLTQREMADKLSRIEMVAFELGMAQSNAMRTGREVDVMGGGMDRVRQRLSSWLHVEASDEHDEEASVVKQEHSEKRKRDGGLTNGESMLIEHKLQRLAPNDAG